MIKQPVVFGFFVAAALFIGSVPFAPQVLASPPEQLWAQSNMTTGSFYGVAMSSSGMIQTAVTEGNGIYYSTDAGHTWQQSTMTSGLFYGMAMSSSGTIQTATANSNGIYYSSDSGHTWQQASGTVGGFDTIAMSSDGMIQTAGSDANHGVYYSSDYGHTWQQSDLTYGFIEGVAVSSSGTIQTAVSDSGAGIFYSSDAGHTWQPSNITSGSFGGVAMSSDGTVQTAAGLGGTIYYSTDYGHTWNASNAISGNYLGVAMSSDGTIQTVGSMGNGVWYSVDYGHHWFESDLTTGNFWGVAMSSNGTIQTADSSSNGGIYYLEVDESPPPPAAPTVLGATTNADGTVITVSFDKAMNNPSSYHGYFDYKDNNKSEGEALAVNGASLHNGDATKIDLTSLAGAPIASGDTVTIDYNGHGSGFEATDGSEPENFSDLSVANAVVAPPTLVNAGTNVDGTKIILTFSKAMSDPAAYVDDFGYEIEGVGAGSFTSAVLENGDDTKIDLTINTGGESPGDVQQGQTVYVSCSGSDVTSADGGVLAPVSNFGVTNNRAGLGPSDASLSEESTIKGVVVHDFGQGGFMGFGEITLSAAEATQASGTLFVPTDPDATVTKVVKYSRGEIPNEDSFAAAPAFSDASPVENDDSFAIEVTSADQTVVSYYWVWVRVESSTNIPSRLVFLFPPATSTASSNLQSAFGFFPVVVEAVDADGNTVDSAEGDVTLSIGNNPSGGSLTGVSTTSFEEGAYAIIYATGIDRPGIGYTLVAAVDGLGSVTSDPFNIISDEAPQLGAEAPITLGVVGPTLALDLRNDTFSENASGTDNWTIDTGETGLQVDSITVESSTQVQIAFTGTAASGTISVAASASALASDTSGTNTLSVSVLAPTSTVYVDPSSTVWDSGGHIYGWDGFSDIPSAILAVNSGGTVNVAGGTYDLTNGLHTLQKLVSVVGPGITAETPATVKNRSCNSALSITKSGVSISGLYIVETDGDGNYCGDDGSPVLRIAGGATTTRNVTISGNDIAGGAVGIALRYDSSNATISGNTIHENGTGIRSVGSTGNRITGNTLTNNDEGIAFGSNGDASAADANLAARNTISGNSEYGIVIENGVSAATAPLNISGNQITENGTTGIYIHEGVTGVNILGNTIAGNGIQAPKTGIDTFSSAGIAIHGNAIAENDGGGIHNYGADSTPLDATFNWWGNADGPTLSGDAADIVNDGDATTTYQPFYTDEAMDAISAIPVANFVPNTLVGGGALTLPTDNEAYQSESSTPSVTVGAAIEVDVPDSGGVSTIIMPAGTVIHKTDATNMDATALTGSSISRDSLSGFGSGTVVNGSLQWGIPEIGLTFDTPITLNIYVGPSLNGTTLTVLRSLSLNSGWTGDGIVAPGTCVVANGLCTFQTTKASYFATVATSNAPSSNASVGVASGGGGGGGGGGGLSTGATTTIGGAASSTAGMTHDQLVAYLNTLTAELRTLLLAAQAKGLPLSAEMEQFLAQGSSGSSGGSSTGFTRDLKLGSTGEDVRALQVYLNTHGSPIAEQGDGSTGHETTHFGAATKRALQAFQKKAGIVPASGYFGAQTRAYVNAHP